MYEPESSRPIEEVLRNDSEETDLKPDSQVNFFLAILARLDDLGKEKYEALLTQLSESGLTALSQEENGWQTWRELQNYLVGLKSKKKSS